MKKSIKHLPKRTQEELNTLISLIVSQIKGCEMIILYGSYARKSYVIWDEYVENGITYSYQSDYDILVVVANSNSMITEKRLKFKVEEVYDKIFSVKYRHTPVEFIVEDISRLNKELEDKRYFFTDAVKEGILLYDTKKYKLSKPRALSYVEVQQFAKEYYDVYFDDASELLRSAREYYFEQEKYKIGPFILHQACENFYNTISLVFTNYRPKLHKLDVLHKKYKCFSRDLLHVFPQNTDLEKRCFQLLCDAYIKGRYDINFIVTKEEYEYLLERIEFLKNLVERICLERIEYYGTFEIS